MQIEYATFSEAGPRSYNEDYVRIVEMPAQGRTLFVLCDGMGGHAMGDLASRTVGDAFADFWQENPEFKDCGVKVREACQKASEAIDRKSLDMGAVQMGTTMVMASIEGNKVTIAHTGDSRCYLLGKRDSEGEKLLKTTGVSDAERDVVYQSQDHVHIQYGMEMVAKCFFSNRPEVAVADVSEFKVHPGDVIFLCSDGVSKYVRPGIMKERLMDNRKPEQIADVIKFLCEKSSQDNYCGVIIQVKDGDE